MKEKIIAAVQEYDRSEINYADWIYSNTNKTFYRQEALDSAEVGSIPVPELISLLPEAKDKQLMIQQHTKPRYRYTATVMEDSKGHPFMQVTLGASCNHPIAKQLKKERKERIEHLFNEMVAISICCALRSPFPYSYVNLFLDNIPDKKRDYHDPKIQDLINSDIIPERYPRSYAYQDLYAPLYQHIAEKVTTNDMESMEPNLWMVNAEELNRMIDKDSITEDGVTWEYEASISNTNGHMAFYFSAVVKGHHIDSPTVLDTISAKKQITKMAWSKVDDHLERAKLIMYNLPIESTEIHTNLDQIMLQLAQKMIGHEVTSCQMCEIPIGNRVYPLFTFEKSI